MNKLRYRLVFNKARGLWMAVAEIVKARGKAASPVVGAGSSRSCGVSVHCTLRPLRLALLTAWGGLMVMAPMAQAEIVADPTAAAGQRPEVTQAANGVTQINILRPGAGGVSHNLYQRFDVEASGAVLNNARTPAKTQLAGWVNGNSNLAGGTARIILNEVNSADPSVLRGYLEVAGDRAQVIVANPSGITCSGCGLINANRSTLTTGRPQFDNGSLSGFDINEGEIHIEGDGLDARQSNYTDLLARAVTVNAGIWVNELNLVTGSNQVAVDGTLQQVQAGTATAPTFALDVKALGGMYAGKITLVGTEHGVGVRNAGQIGASAGDITISADGKLENSRQISSASALYVDVSGNIDNSGTLYAQNDLQLTTRGHLHNRDIISAGNDLRVDAVGLSSEVINESGAYIASGVGVDGLQTEQGDLTISANQKITGAGHQSAASNLLMNAASMDLGGGQSQGKDIELVAHRGDIKNRAGRISAEGKLTVTANTQSHQTLNNDAGAIVAKQLALELTNFSNNKGSLEQVGVQDTIISVARVLDNTDGRIASNSQDFTLASATLINSNGQLEHAGTGTLKVDVAKLDGANGYIGSNGLFDLKATTVTLDSGRTVADQFVIDTAILSNRQGHLIQTGHSGATLKATTQFDNTSGVLSNDGDIILTVGALTNLGGTIQASGIGSNLLIAASGAIDNRQQNNTAGQLLASGDSRITADSLINAQGKVSAGDNLAVQLAQSLNNTQGTLVANQRVDVTGHRIDNTQGLLGSVKAQTHVTAIGHLDNTAGRIEATQASRITAAGLTNADGILVASSLIVDSQSQRLDNTRGILSTTGIHDSGALDIQSGVLLNERGLIQAHGSLNINTHNQALLNSDSGIQYGVIGQQNVTLTTGMLDNSTGYIGSSGDLNGQSLAIDNSQGGTVVSERSINLTGTSLDNQDGEVQAKENLTLAFGSGVLNSTRGLIRSGQQLTITADTIKNINTQNSNQGLEGASLTLTAQQGMDNTDGAIRAGNHLLLRGGGTLDNRGGLISSSDRITVQDTHRLNKALVITNTAGTFIAGNHLTFDSAGLSGDGKLLSQGDIKVTVDKNYTHSGQLQANGSASLVTQGTLENNSLIEATLRLELEAATLNNHSGGQIRGQKVLLNATAPNTLVNRGVIDGQDTLIDTITLNNLGTGRIYGDHVAIKATTINNRTEMSDAPVIASRNRLDIGATTINNEEHALLFSAGNLFVGGTLDANDQASGQATTLNNKSATIEALGDLELNVTDINNTNEHFDAQEVIVGTQSIIEYQGSGSSNRYLAGTPDLYTYHDKSTHLHTPDGNYATWYRYNYIRTTKETQVVSSDPAKILAGGNILLTASDVLNDMSEIIAGGTLSGTIDTLNNTAVTGKRTQSDAGTVTQFWHQKKKKWYGKVKHSTGASSTGYSPAVSEQTISLTPTVYQQGTHPSGTGTTLGTLSIGTLTQTPSGATGIHATSQSRTNIKVITQVTLLNGATSHGVNTVVRSGGVNISLPSNSLYPTHPDATASYLVETDPRYSGYRQWLSSDYMLDQLQLDPARTMKRLGDGFYEQRLIQQQITQLTGQRYLAGYSDDEAQYQSLMSAGVTFALAYDLTPGIALSAEMMAQLTSDIVWLVEQSVTLADGTQQNVLVPQVYAVLQEGDVTGGGALLGGQIVAFNLTGDLYNEGTLTAADTLALNAQDITNRRGTLVGDRVQLSAIRDIANIAGSMRGQDSLKLIAGQDISVSKAIRKTENKVGDSQYEQVALDGIGTLHVSNPNATLSAAAGRDINLATANIVNDGVGGTTTLEAGRDLNLTATNTRRRDAIVWDAGNYLTNGLAADVGTTISSAGDLKLLAERDINSRAATLNSEANAQLVAGQDINLTAGESEVTLDRKTTTRRKGLFSSKTTVDENRSTQRQALGAVLSAERVQLVTGQDIKLEGASVVGANDVELQAGKNIIIASAEQTSTTASFHQTTKKGLFSSNGGFGITLGKMQKTDQVDQQQTTQVSSTIGALNGDITLNAGNDVTVTASDLLARQGSIQIEGDNITIDSADDTLDREEEHKFKQSGLTLALSGGVIDTLQTIKSSVERIDSAKDGRLKALHAWRIGRIAQDLPKQVDNLDHLGKDMETPTKANTPKDQSEIPQSSGLNLTVSLGSSSSQQQISQHDRTALGSSLIADQQITLRARGETEQDDGATKEPQATGGDIHLEGALLEAGTITLDANNDISLTSAENKFDRKETSKSKSSGIGISIGSGGLQFFVEGSRSRGLVNQSDDRYLETLINAKEKATLTSGNDTTLKGAQVNAKRIEVNSGGDLNIISQQDQEQYQNKQQSLGGRIGVGIGPNSPVSVSINASKLKANSTYIAVQEQSGLFAGEEGFYVQVAQNTHLQGGAIVSEATPDKNRLNTETLSHGNLVNHAKYDVESKSISFSTSAMDGITKGLGGGFSDDSGSASNTTYAALSDGDITVRSNPNQRLDALKKSREEAHRVLERIFSEEMIQQMQEEREAFALLAEEGARAIGDYAVGKRLEAAELRNLAKNKEGQERQVLLKEADELEERWKEGGSARVMLHMAVGALSDGIKGLVGAGLTATAIPELDSYLKKQGVPGGMRSNILLAASAGIGGVIGGEQGALSSTSQTSYNYLTHQQQEQLADLLNECRDSSAPNCAERIEGFQNLSDYNNKQLLLAKQQCDATGKCESLNALIKEGMAWGYGAAIILYDDPLSPMIADEMTEQARKDLEAVVDILLNRNLSEETVFIDEVYDEATHFRIESGFKSAISEQNENTRITVAVVAGSLILPGPEDLVVGAFLMTKAGQAVGRVFEVAGEKMIRLADGRVATVNDASSKQILLENNVRGNSFDDYVAATKLKGLEERGLLGRQERLPTPDIDGKNYIKPDYTIYSRDGRVAVYADAKAGGVIPFDAQARGLLEWAATTNSKTLVYYTPQGTAQISPYLLNYARQAGVIVRQVGIE